ncbi:transposase [Rhodocaloribacter sp.]
MKDYRRYRTHTRSRRLQGYDYARAGVYFVTLCTHERTCLFGRVVEGEVRLDAAGRIAAEEWVRSAGIRTEVRLDAWGVMPNHVHGLVVIVPPDADPDVDYTDPHGYRMDVWVGATDGVEATGRSPLHRGPSPKSLGSFIAGFKSAATKRINRMRGTPGAPVWQRNYHDHVVRNERVWRALRRYVAGNPARWDTDENNLEP